ncbi:MAG: alpha/beta fold hydrolase [Thermoanaerobaculia bacterium]|nr:alpha/beta fold hydrolase [Thermoanaerobaculia bacterium]
MHDTIPFLIDGPENGDVIVLAHGAGAGMESGFLADLATRLSRLELRVVRFEFPYMRRRRSEGSRRPPDRPPVLLDCWREVVAQLGSPQRLVIGGKSMGGRIASMVADELGVAGLVCIGYPFHPPGSPEKLRTEHLANLATPTLILQGERDSFGLPGEVAGYDLSSAIRVEWLADGDHSLKPRRSSGFTAADHLATVARSLSDFVASVTPPQ